MEPFSNREYLPKVCLMSYWIKTNVMYLYLKTCHCKNFAVEPKLMLWSTSCDSITDSFPVLQQHGTDCCNAVDVLKSSQTCSKNWRFRLEH